MLSGEFVGLRAVEPSDLPKLLVWRNNPEFRRYFREFKELSSEHQKLWYEKTVLANEHVLMFSIVDLKNNELLGACGLCYINWVHRNADFSIYIGARDLYIDDHYAVDAARILLAYGFGELGLHKVWAEIYDFDEQKKKLFEVLGFAFEGRHCETYWHDGTWHDSLFYGLLNV